ncbi:MAG: hypothetical protein HY537_17510 [Deltaproteobacteria bacterium]|nr:hypothetical protein [Deltaproteobacteria bacterium]
MNKVCTQKEHLAVLGVNPIGYIVCDLDTFASLNTFGDNINENRLFRTVGTIYLNMFFE